MPPTINTDLAKQMKTQRGESLFDLSQDQPILLIFLRHFGCLFCREALYDLSKMQEEIKKKGVKLAFVHMAEPKIANKYFSDFGLKDVESVSDQSCQFYKAFGLLKGNFRQLYGLKVWMRGVEAGITKGLGFSTQQIGDGFQMPGVFFVKEGKILDSFIHHSIADKPDYDRMINCC